LFLRKVVLLSTDNISCIPGDRTVHTHSWKKLKSQLYNSLDSFLTRPASFENDDISTILKYVNPDKGIHV
jgi:hypothetical protein